MNKAILMSIRPQHAVNILNGKKTLELRKRVPKGFKGWVYIYVTKAKPYLIEYEGRYSPYTILQEYIRGNLLNGKVVARFWFDDYIAYKYYEDDNSYFAKRPQDFGYNAEEVLKRLCLSQDEFKTYGKGKDLYALHIKRLEIFDEPMELSDFYKRIDGLDEDGGYILASSNESVTIPQLRKKYLVQRPPQSWQYVWVKE